MKSYMNMGVPRFKMLLIIIWLCLAYLSLETLILDTFIS